MKHLEPDLSLKLNERHEMGKRNRYQIMACIEGLTKAEQDMLSEDSGFLPHWTLGESSESIYYVEEDAEAFCYEVTRRFLIKRKLPDDLHRVDILRLLTVLFPDVEIKNFSDFRDKLLRFKYEFFVRELDLRREYLRKLLTEYKYELSRNQSKLQDEKNIYRNLLIRSNITNLKRCIDVVIEAAEERYLRSYAHTKTFPHKSFLMLSGFYRDFFISADWFSLERVEERFRWMDFLPAGDYLKINQTNNLEILNKHIPGTMNTLNEYIQSNEWVPEMTAHVDSINEAMKAYNAGFKRAAITLMLRENEGLVWDLARRIADNHNISFDKERQTVKMPNYSKPKEVTSLPALLKLKDWPPIFRRPEGTADNATKINLGERLGYLTLDYSNERNAIIHGINNTFDQDWKWFELISACIDILSVFEEYQEITSI